ncbi:MAG: GTP cyclohydrolase I [Bordetella sp.]|uniref:GTP cyclohydrolase I n=1 Tax=Bordetella sp. TaxID=28081 RepID=UPI003F7CAB4B
MDAMVKDMPALVETPDGTPLSLRIRQRLLSAGTRFHANDNIADYLCDGEIELLQDEVADRMQEVLRALVIDVDSDHNSRETARRVAKMFVREVFSGRYEPAPDVTEFPNVERLEELMIVGPVTIRSACSHHLCPIIGRLWIGVLPDQDSNLIGLSKYARLAQWIMSRPQIQEEAIKQLADLLESRLAPKGVAVVLEADHFCMHWRGVKDDQSQMVNSVMRGAFVEDKSLRAEFLSLLPKRG